MATLRGCFWHPTDFGKKSQFWGPCDSLSHGALKMGFFPNVRYRARNTPVRRGPLHPTFAAAKDPERVMNYRTHTRLSYSSLSELSVSDGSLCGLENREGPWPGGGLGGVRAQGPSRFSGPQRTPSETIVLLVPSVKLLEYLLSY